ncbi:hypothetical protein SDC9_156163 [bioreactor metagenome]|uniref:Uncharacterized protein n=1 Tax=bioreactor metagenome TaxID=1076179 RepID=A0A645F3Y5_9ZZZZ
MAQRIHSCCGGKAFGHAQSYQRIENGNICNHRVVIHALFQPIIVVFHYGNLCSFRTGTCGGWYCNEKGGQSGSDTAVHLIILSKPSVGSHHADSLRRIEDTAAADCEGTIATFSEIEISAIVDHMQIRFAFDSIIYKIPDSS